MELEGWGPRTVEVCAWCRAVLPEDCWRGRFCSRAHAAAASRDGFLREPAPARRDRPPARFTAVCWWCGGTFPTPTREARYCSTTHSDNASKARRRRRLRAAARRERTGLPPCPRPDKQAHPTLDTAWAVVRGMTEQGLVREGEPLRAYWCVCGEAHVGHVDADRERRWSTPLDPAVRRERGLHEDDGWGRSPEG